MTLSHTAYLEGGLRNHRIDSILESSGTIDATGTFSPFSDVTKRCLWAPDAGMVARRGIGSVDAVGHDTGPESHVVTVGFLLQGGIAAGVPLYEALYRDADGLIETRTIIDREQHSKGGTDSDGILRTYMVAEGAKPTSARITGDPGTPGPMEAEIIYNAAKVRSYQISQPAAAATLVASGSGTITIEDDQGTSESFAGTSTAQFDSIDAAYLTAELDSTMEVTNADTGATLVVIYGKDKYNNVEGDMGVPTDATHSATLGGDYERFLGDTITLGSGSLALDINSLELSVANNLVSTAVHNSLKQRISEGNHVIQVTATVMGETESHDNIMRHLQGNAADIVWALTDSTLTVEEAVLIDPGDRAIEGEQTFLQLNNVFEGTAITIA